MRLQVYDKKGSECTYLVKDQPTKSRFEVPLNEQINQIVTMEEKMSEVKLETEKHEVQHQAKEVILAGWPEKPNFIFNCTRRISLFSNVQESIIFCNERVIIPKSL